MTDKVTIGCRFEEGAYLPQAVEDVAVTMQEPFLDVAGFGELAWVDLEGPHGEPLRFEGPLVLTDFKGRLRTVGGVVLRDYVCTLARHTDNGIQMLGGKLIRARVKFAEVSIFPLDDPSGEVALVSAEATRSDPVEKLVSDSSMPEPPAPPPKVESATTKDLGNKWAKALDESNRVQQKAKDEGYDFDEPEVRPKRGDFVNHRQFGKCSVIKMGDEHITLAKPDKRKVQLGLSILKFTLEGDENDRKVFRVEVQVKR